MARHVQLPMPADLNYGITELEGLGVVWAVKYFQPYLYGHRCEVYTDDAALTSLLNTPQPSGKLARCGMAIQELDLQITHQSGRSNANTNALLRTPLPAGENPNLGDTVGVVANFQTAEDMEAALITEYLKTGVLPACKGFAYLYIIICIYLSTSLCSQSQICNHCEMALFLNNFFPTCIL